MRKYSTKTDWVAGQLRSAISSGRIKPGEPIRIRDWANKLDVSDTPVREAVKSLAAAGYLTVSPHRGARVTSFSTDEFLEFRRLRGALDALAAEFAVERVSTRDRYKVCDQLSRLNTEILQAVDSGDLNRAHRINREFHATVYSAAGFSLLIEMRDRIWDVFPVKDQIFWNIISSSDSARAQMVNEHEAIIEALRSGDPARAGAAAKRHIESGVRRVMEGEAVAQAEPTPAATTTSAADTRRVGQSRLREPTTRRAVRAKSSATQA